MDVDIHISGGSTQTGFVLALGEASKSGKVSSEGDASITLSLSNPNLHVVAVDDEQQLWFSVHFGSECY